MNDVGGVLAVWTSGESVASAVGYSALTTERNNKSRTPNVDGGTGWSGRPQTHTSTTTTKFIIQGSVNYYPVVKTPRIGVLGESR